MFSQGIVSDADEACLLILLDPLRREAHAPRACATRLYDLGSKACCPMSTALIRHLMVGLKSFFDSGRVASAPEIVTRERRERRAAAACATLWEDVT